MGFARHKGCGERNRDSLRVTMKEVLVETITVFVVRAGELYLLHRRPSKGLLAGMWEFPNCVGEGGQGKKALTAELAAIGVRVEEVSGPVKQIRHVFSHKVWQMSVYEARAAKDVISPPVVPSGWRWVPVTELADFNLAGPHNRILRDVDELTTK